MASPSRSRPVSVIEEIDEMIRLRAVRLSSINQMQKWKAEIERLLRERSGWQRTALAMRDAAIFWDRDAVSRYERIEQMYMDAALLDKFTEVYHDEKAEDAAKA